MKRNPSSGQRSASRGQSGSQAPPALGPWPRALGPLLALILFSAPASAQVGAGSVQNSPHNLSASGPGAIRATAEGEICVFCHTPHNAAPIQPLWNRNVPVSAYQPYTSRSFQATPGQPTGSSKLCLSCHDGTIALGSVLSRNQPISMAGGMTTIPAGRASNLGTDLRDDHPISFRYDAALVTRDPKIKDPALLPSTMKLDRNFELQCTTCHDAHSNTNGNFLVMPNATSQLCTACHTMGTTQVAEHVQCAQCHQSHSAPSGPFLLKKDTVTNTCLACHSGQPGSTNGPNIAADLSKLSRHDTNPPVTVATVPSNTTCSDCHEPHTMLTTTASAPNLAGRYGRIDGLNAAGAKTPTAQFEYEVCFKCHADQPALQPRITRQIVQANSRLKFAPAAISFHPVEVAGKNSTTVPSLLPPWTSASLMYCADCHNSDSGTKAGGGGPNGVHGSNVPSVLLAGYQTTDRTPESATAYALCYKCHNRTSILANQSFTQHKKHIVDQKTPCSVCHDPHGISSAQGTAANNAHLINFDTTVVTASSSGQLKYVVTGTRRGQCFLRCHGTNHNPKSY